MVADRAVALLGMCPSQNLWQRLARQSRLRQNTLDASLAEAGLLCEHVDRKAAEPIDLMVDLR
jgi:CII-binding regulator of phage lambda lysogenization HflD